MIGKSVAHYQITALLGKGGMGQVYRATDTRLKRQVALKILPKSLAGGPQRMGRFQRKAEALAALNHPNIAGIYGLEREGDTLAIAMELVEGETLAARIQKGPIRLDEALPLARVADQRSDIWSFGAVLFEMLSGEKPFAGEDVAEILASVVKVDVDWDSLPEDTPGPVAKWLVRCLQADPKKRYHAMGDLRLDIEDYLANPELPSAIAPVSPPAASWMSPALWALRVTAVLLSVRATWFLMPRPELPLIKSTIAPDKMVPFPSPPVISPDGRMLAYSIADDLWVQRLDRISPDPIPDSTGAQLTFFSPDSRFLAFGLGERLWKVDLASMARTPICDLPANFGGGAWGRDGSIVFGTWGNDGRLYRVTDLGTLGQPQQQISDPSLSPEGPWVGVRGQQEGNYDIWLHHVEQGSKRRLTFAQTEETNPVWTPAGDEVAFTREGNPNEIWIRPADNSGESRKLTEGEWPTFSADGRFLAFHRLSPDTGDSDIWDLDWQTKGEPEPYLVAPDRQFRPSLSPDGRWIDYSSSESGPVEIRVKKFPSGEGLWQISTEGGNTARWSPDGDELFYLNGPEVMAVSIRGTDSLDHGTPRRLFRLLGRQGWGYALPLEGTASLSRALRGVMRPLPPSSSYTTGFSEFRNRD